MNSRKIYSVAYRRDFYDWLTHPRRDLEKPHGCVWNIYSITRSRVRRGR